MKRILLLACLLVSPALAYGQDDATAMLFRNNAVRATVGLGPHRLDQRLSWAAQDHANYMAATGDFQHYSNGGPNGRAAKYGFNSQVLENIAMGQPTITSAFNTWRASGGHWASMSGSSSDAGFGYAIGRNGQTYWVAVYGNVAPRLAEKQMDANQFVSLNAPVPQGEVTPPVFIVPQGPLTIQTPTPAADPPPVAPTVTPKAPESVLIIQCPRGICPLLPPLLPRNRAQVQVTAPAGSDTAVSVSKYRQTVTVTVTTSSSPPVAAVAVPPGNSGGFHKCHHKCRCHRVFGRK